jgi:hypothetical protein
MSKLVRILLWLSSALSDLWDVLDMC